MPGWSGTPLHRFQEASFRSTPGMPVVVPLGRQSVCRNHTVQMNSHIPRVDRRASSKAGGLPGKNRLESDRSVN